MRAFDAEPWQDRAACLEEDPELFFPPGSTGPSAVQAEEAKTVCRRCPVKLDCAGYAVRTKAANGVWGGVWLVDQVMTRARVRREVV